MSPFPTKKWVVELRYKPDLAFYNRMDEIGRELGEEFPDWQRSALTLDIRSKRRHRRLFLTHNRSFLEADLVDQPPDTDFAVKTLEKLCAKLDVKTCLRVGVRQWFVADLAKTFAVMVDEFSQRFLSQEGAIGQVLTDKIRDVGYVVDYETSDGWKYNLRAGPMLKKQWFQTVNHEPGLFESPDEGEMTFEKFRDAFPEQFLYLDLDWYVEDNPVNKLSSFVATSALKSRDLAARLVDICKE